MKRETPLTDAEKIAIRRLHPAWSKAKISKTFNATLKRVDQILSEPPPQTKKVKSSRRKTQRSYGLFRSGHGKYS